MDLPRGQWWIQRFSRLLAYVIYSLFLRLVLKSISTRGQSIFETIIEVLYITAKFGQLQHTTGPLRVADDALHVVLCLRGSGSHNLSGMAYPVEQSIHRDPALLYIHWIGQLNASKG